MFFILLVSRKQSFNSLKCLNTCFIFIYRWHQLETLGRFVLTNFDVTGVMLISNLVTPMFSPLSLLAKTQALSGQFVLDKQTVFISKLQLMLSFT